MSEIQEILSHKWERYVGRRQPPLRGDLAFRGVLKWFRQNFHRDMSNLYLFFSELTEKGMISDHYIHKGLKESIVNEIKKSLLKNPHYADPYLNDFRKNAENLNEFSLKLKKIKDFENEDMAFLFKEFCKRWEDFGPNLYVFLLIIEGCENVILDGCKRISGARTKLMKVVSSKVKSEFFNSMNKTPIIDDPFPEKYAPYIRLLADMMEYRDKRKVIYDNSWYSCSEGFLRYLGDTSCLGEKVLFLGRHQIENVLKGGNIEIKMPSMICAKDEKIKIKYGEEAARLKSEILNSTINSFNEVMGNIANTGKTKGKTRLVEPHLENQIFKEGEILITRMTTPDLMPFIKKASAIVTDEGGITCHAAIVSRELDIPCIIGTKAATQVFRDGDLIEVDAEKGIVRKVDDKFK